jgi:hypothetical protein
MREVRLGFGCAGLMQSPEASHRQLLLGEAYEGGIRHFDVARMYGLGVAEAELGKFARGRRDELVIATKFGIEPSAAARRLAPLQAPARRLVKRSPTLRLLLRRREGALHVSGKYSAAKARSSLEHSLRALGTDYVDFFFVHGPEPSDSIAMDELGAELEQLRNAGKIGAWGIAGDPAVCHSLAQSSERAPVLQVSDSLLAPASFPPDREPTISFGILSGALGRVSSHLASNPEKRREWQVSVGVDCGDPIALAPLLLRDALDRNEKGVVLFSTTNPDRIAAALTAAGAGGDLDALRVRAAELGATPDGP